MTSAPDLVHARLEDVSRAPTLLVASDYDGVLAPIVDQPELAYARPASLTALRSLVTLPNTQVAVVSGRSLAVLTAFTGLPDAVHHVGSHGSEFATGMIAELDDTQLELRDAITTELRELAARHGDGFAVEEKPGSVALHYRNADPVAADAAVAAVLDGPGSWPGVQVKKGKKVVELAVFLATKGTAVESLRQQFGADAVVFLGDDVTDEDVFAVLGPGDVGIKVGPGDTLAELRIGDPVDATDILEALVDLRRRHIDATTEAAE